MNEERDESDENGLVCKRRVLISMVDKDKVIKGLKCCVDRPISELVCEECPYKQHYIQGAATQCFDVLLQDSLDLLEEQEYQTVN